LPSGEIAPEKSEWVNDILDRIPAHVETEKHLAPLTVGQRLFGCNIAGLLQKGRI